MSQTVQTTGAFPVIAVGGSLGSMQVLQEVARGLPATLAAALVVVLHTSADAPGLAPQLLQNHHGLRAGFAADGQELLAGQIFIAPPDWHLSVVPDGLKLRSHLERGPKVNRHRPAVDPLFRSVAQTCGPGAIGLILSGMLDDGAAGLFAIAASGGKTLVQDPDSAAAPDMPKNALRETRADFVLSPADIAPQLIQLVASGGRGKSLTGAGPGVAFARKRRTASFTPLDARPGRGPVSPGPAPGVRPFSEHAELTEFACPECHGVLSLTGPPPRFRCRIGHIYGLASLNREYADGVELALWVAVRALREKSSLARRIAGHAAPARRRDYLDQAAATDRHADCVRDIIQQLLNLNARPEDLTRHKHKPSLKLPPK